MARGLSRLEVEIYVVSVLRSEVLREIQSKILGAAAVYLRGLLIYERGALAVTGMLANLVQNSCNPHKALSKPLKNLLNPKP